jgi:predicted nucleic acid-binding protein
VVIIDTDVLLLAYAFPRDVRQEANFSFLRKVKSDFPATTIYNLMELLGQLSFNVSAERLAQWKSWLVDAHQLAIIWPVNPDQATDALSFRQEIYDRPLARMQTSRIAFMDALIVDLAERTPAVERLVTWNARHFQGKTRLEVLTPEAYLERIPRV